MPKKDIAPLFQLIHSMSKMEKRHFKLYSRYNSQNDGEINYLILFDLIEKQTEYDEEKIIRKGIVKKEHLRMLKNYLYNLILESLRVLRNKGNETDIQIKNLVENELIMREKGIESEEYKYLFKAKQLALENERWGAALDILLRESAKRTRERNSTEQEKIEKEITELLGKMKNLIALKKEHREIEVVLKKADRRKTRKSKDLERMVKKTLNHNLTTEDSALSKKEAFLTRMTWQNALGDFKGAFKTNQEAMDFIKSNYSKLDLAEVHYASILNNITCMQFELKDYKGAFETIERHRSFIPKTSPVKDRVFAFTYTNEANCYLLTGEFEKGIAATKDKEQELLNIKHIANTRVIHSLYFNIASLYFGAGHYENALRWTRRTTNAARGEAPEDIQSWAHILTVLIHYEKKTNDIIEHLTSSAYRYLVKRDRLYKAEEEILDFLRRISAMDDSKKIIQAEFIKFRNEFIQITKDPKEQNALYYFDIISWLESKIENKSLGAIMKEKSQLKKGN